MFTQCLILSVTSIDIYYTQTVLKTVLRAPHQILYQRGKGNMRYTNDPPCEKNNQT